MPVKAASDMQRGKHALCVVALLDIIFLGLFVIFVVLAGFFCTGPIDVPAGPNAYLSLWFLVHVLLVLLVVIMSASRSWFKPFFITVVALGAIIADVSVLVLRVTDGIAMVWPICMIVVTIFTALFLGTAWGYFIFSLLSMAAYGWSGTSATADEDDDVADDAAAAAEQQLNKAKAMLLPSSERPLLIDIEDVGSRRRTGASATSAAHRRMLLKIGATTR